MIFINEIEKFRDNQGNTIIKGAEGSLYKIVKKISLIATGSFCKIK